MVWSLNIYIVVLIVPDVNLCGYFDFHWNKKKNPFQSILIPSNYHINALEYDNYCGLPRVQVNRFD